MAITAKEHTTRPYNNTPQGINMTSKERHEARYQRRKAAREVKRRAYLDQYNNFDRVANIPALLRANWDSRKGVMFKASVLRYNMSAYRNASRQVKNLKAGKDVRQGFYSFQVMERGKVRDIHSVHYSERVIRRAVCINSLVPILSHNLIYDNGASLKGRGVSHHARRCEAHLHRFYRENGGNDGYAICVDFTSYFKNILHEPLYRNLDKYILDPGLNALEKRFIAAPDDFERPVKEHGRGLYIGPEDSQILAVSYPNSIDHKIKDQWRIKQYARYNDDSYLLVKDLPTAKILLGFLFTEYDRLGIIPNKRKTQIVKLSNGFSFLKTRYYLLPSGKVIRKPNHKSIVRTRRRMKKHRAMVDAGVMTEEQATQSFMSARSAILTRDAYGSVHSLDQLFYKLYGKTPWKKIKRRKYYGRKA